MKPKHKIIEKDGSWRIIKPNGVMVAQKFESHEKAYESLRHWLAGSTYRKLSLAMWDKHMDAKRRTW